ncbi:MAG: ribosome assembly cofactor RimP [Bacteroidetes bacterium]|nr:ribosome assembly cofactor RimP [Bacteroidota bacterium]MBU1117124.1 ribosome assembly cofactor RimP [Bacteroidota bacterium]MBU1798655.1 ribosome assembly cofactor RimP [Bacteroidota bacterium]
MNINKSEISDKIKKTVEQLGYLLVDINFRGNDNDLVLEIFIDNEDGIITSDCVDVSRACGDLLEEENLIESKYRLDVSSPGIERPLIYIQQYKKNIDRYFELEFEEQVAEKFEGKLLSVNEDILKFEIDKKIEEVNFKNIKSAKVIIRF